MSIHRRGIAPQDCAPGSVPFYTGANWVCEAPHRVKPACHEGYTAKWVGTHFVCVPKKGARMSGLGAQPSDQAFQGGIFTAQPEKYRYQTDALEAYSDGSLGLVTMPSTGIMPRTAADIGTRVWPGGFGGAVPAQKMGLPAIPAIWPGMPPQRVSPQVSGMGQVPEPFATILKLAPLAGGLAGTYHGYLRNKGSVGWAIGWGVFGSVLWFIAMPLMFAQGIGQPAGK